MSKLFFDHLIELKEIDKQIKRVAKSTEEKEELWLLVDEIIHHKVMGCILDKLPREHHEEFLDIFHKSPHDSDLLIKYLRSRTNSDIEDLIIKEINDFSLNLLDEIKSS